MRNILHFLIFTVVCLALSNGQWTQRRQEVVDRNGKYVVGWIVNHENKVIVFDVQVETLGYVGFGLSHQGGMLGADIVIGGVFDNNSTRYFSDRFGIGFVEPVIDPVQDWTLLSASQNSTHTNLVFSRVLNSCDDNDIALTNDTTNIIWAFGNSDYITYHTSTNRGIYAVNILDPGPPPLDMSQFRTFKVAVNNTMLSQETTYWCEIHRSPTFQRKQHVVAFDGFLPSEAAKKHTHHFVVYECTAPSGVDPDEFFSPFIGHPGDECHTPKNPVRLPVERCQKIFYSFAVGGKPLIYPENIGYPIGDGVSADYYMIEVHYDNPDQLAGVTFETGATFYYTDVLRPEEAGTLVLGHQITVGLTIPPKSTDFMVVAHCSPEFTNAVLPPEGVRIFNGLLHSHLSGRKIKLRHFRGNQELPWIMNDDHYNFEYQQNRPLREEITLLPGDQMTVECRYDTNWATGTTIGGLSTRLEMCEAFVSYYPKGKFDYCMTTHPVDNVFERFGILNATWGNDPLSDPVILDPPHLANMTYTRVLDTLINWTPSERADFQRQLRYDLQEDNAFSPDGNVDFRGRGNMVGYPEIEQEFQPIDECA